MSETDKCRARGCGGLLLMRLDRWIGDGSKAYCDSCGRRHTLHVPYDGGPVRVKIDRKPRPTTGKVRGRGGLGGWVTP